MKKIRNLLMICFLVLSFNTIAQFPNPYCGNNFTTRVEPITLVQFAGINNPSTNTIGGTSPSHENYTTIFGNVTAGTTIPITVKGNTDGNYTCYFRVYFDWNGDGDFTDAGETFDIGTITNSTGVDSKTVTTDIAIPYCASPNISNTVRMRVIKNYNSYSANSCGNYSYGQSEDYSINVVYNYLETTPFTPLPYSSVTDDLQLGPNAYYDLVLDANTYYNFNWTNNSTSGFIATVINGGIGATSTTFTNTTFATPGWFSGTPAPTLRVNAIRNGCDWNSTSAILSYNRVTALPVELIDFTSTCYDDNVLLDWSTASEKNSDKFIVEKSRYLDEWVYVTEIQAQGNSNTRHNYTVIDDSWNGISYYRLRQVDLNGDEKIYGPISNVCNRFGLDVLPNPNDGRFAINIYSNETYLKSNIIITDLSGKVIHKRMLNIKPGTTIMEFNLDIESGSYVIYLENDGTKIISKRFIVTK